MVIPEALQFFLLLSLAFSDSYPHLKHMLPARINVPSTTLMVHLIKNTQEVSARTSLLEKSISQHQGTQKNCKLIGCFSPKISPPVRMAQSHHAYLPFLKNITYFRLRKKQNIQETQFFWT